MSADWMERLGLPLVVAFAAGVIVADYGHEQEAAALHDGLRKALAKHVHQADELERWHMVCGPLMQWPLEEAPEVLAASPLPLPLDEVAR